MVLLLMESMVLDMALLPLVLLLVLDMVLLDMELLLVPALLEALPMPDTESVKLMLRPMLMPMLDTVMLPQLPPLPLSAPVSQSGPATRFPSPPQGRLPRLSARRSLMFRSSRTVPRPSPPLAPSNLPSNLTLLLLLELTPELDQKLLLPTMAPLLLPLMLMLLVQLLLEELLPLDMVPDTVPVLLEVLSVMLAQLLLDTLVPELVLLDMPHGNQEKQYSLFRHLHY